MYHECTTDDDALRRVIALESARLADSTEAISNFFPAMMKKLYNSFTSPKTIPNFVPSIKNKIFGLNSDERAIIAKLASIPYDDLINFKVPVPEGFSGNYTAYLMQCMENIDYYNLTTKNALEDYYIFVADLVTNKDAKKSLKDLQSKNNALKKSRQEIGETTNKFFIKGSNVAALAYGTAFSDNSEVEKLFRARVDLTSKIKSIDLHSVSDQVEKITQTLDTLTEQATAGNYEAFSPVQMKNISEGAYEMAAQVEFTSINYYRASVVLKTVEALEPALLKRVNIV